MLLRTRSLLLAAALVRSFGCRTSEPADDAAPPPTKDASVALPPLVAPSTALMPVPGFGNAVLISPVGATSPKPLVVAVLGIGDTPESQCAVWRELLASRAFVVCPRFTPHFVQQAPEGQAVGDGLLSLLGLQGPQTASADPANGPVVQSGFRPTEVPEVEREIDAAVAAARKTLPKYVASGPALYIGFSRGAFLGASLVAKTPAKYPRAILIEGGQTAWNDATAAAFAKGGGKRVLFACGQPSCIGESTASAGLLEHSHVSTRIVHGEGEGHSYKGAVKDQIRASLPWVLEGDAAWAAAR